MIKLIIYFGIIATLASCGVSKEDCERLQLTEASLIRSRNAVNEMHQSSPYEKSKQALNDADDAIDQIQQKIIKECNR
jgi:hypothetical protein